MCPIALERMVVLGDRGGQMLHEIEISTGRVIRSGFPSDPSISDPDEAGLPDGWMSCDAGATEFLITWAGYPVLDIVDATSWQLVTRKLLPPGPGDRELSAFGRAFTYKSEYVVQATLEHDSHLTPDSVFLFHRDLQTPARVVTGHQRLFPLGGDSAVLVTGVDRFSLELVSLSTYLKSK
jgi:hypothetical protein